MIALQKHSVSLGTNAKIKKKSPTGAILKSVFKYLTEFTGQQLYQYFILIKLQTGNSDAEFLVWILLMLKY